MKNRIKIFNLIVLSLSVWSIRSAIMISPFDYSSVYSPTGIYRISQSSTLTVSPSTFTITYPTNFINIPIIIYSVSSISFNRGIKYNLTLMTSTNTSATLNLLYDSTVTKIGLLVMIFDSSLYNAALTYFSYTMPPGVNSPQTFAVTDTENHMASFLVGLHATLGPFPSGYAPQADSFILVDTASIISANLSITYDPGQLSIINYIVLFVDFQISLFIASPYAGYGQQFAIYGTSGFATQTTQTGSYMSNYRNNYFTGLQTIYDGQFLFGTLSLDIVAMLNTNIYYYISQLLFVSYHCPNGFPYIDSSRSYCYSDCNLGYYADAQYVCQPCNSNCLTCFNMSTNCTSCNSPYVLIYGFVCGCSENSFQVTNANGSFACLVCSTYISGCYSCTSATNCIKCMNNLILTTPLLCSCPVGTVARTVSIGIICLIITSALAPQSEYCASNMIMNYTTCTCPSYLNLTFDGGLCF